MQTFNLIYYAAIYLSLFFMLGMIGFYMAAINTNLNWTNKISRPVILGDNVSHFTMINPRYFGLINVRELTYLVLFVLLSFPAVGLYLSLLGAFIFYILINHQNMIKNKKELLEDYQGYLYELPKKVLEPEYNLLWNELKKIPGTRIVKVNENSGKEVKGVFIGIPGGIHRADGLNIRNTLSL